MCLYITDCHPRRYVFPTIMEAQSTAEGLGWPWEGSVVWNGKRFRVRYIWVTFFFLIYGIKVFNKSHISTEEHIAYLLKPEQPSKKSVQILILLNKLTYTSGIELLYFLFFLDMWHSGFPVTNVLSNIALNQCAKSKQTHGQESCLLSPAHAELDLLNTISEGRLTGGRTSKVPTPTENLSNWFMQKGF